MKESAFYSTCGALIETSNLYIALKQKTKFHYLKKKSLSRISVEVILKQLYAQL